MNLHNIFKDDIEPIETIWQIFKFLTYEKFLLVE